MSPLRLAAVSTVTVALALYTAGSLREWRARRASRGVLALLTAGVGFDVTATALMIVAAGSEGVTLHGVLGYSALALMATDVALLWRHRARAGEAALTAGLHLYSRLAWGYWVVAYFTGAALVMMSRGRG